MNQKIPETSSNLIDSVLSMENSSVHKNQLRLVAWEVTRKCNLNCIHCRAGSERGPYPGELDTGKCLEILGDISEVGRPIIILTGGSLF